MDQVTGPTPESAARALAEIRDEFAHQWATEPVGIIGTCYLGRPYEVHTLTLDGGIVTHYKAGQPLPAELEQARSLVTSGLYCCVEVYPDRLVCVRLDGTLAELAVMKDATQ